MSLPRRALLLVCCLALSLPLNACFGGNKLSQISSGDTEGVFLDLDQLKYQVQISRELNPYDNEDRYYLAGLSKADATLGPKQTWFGVFLRVENLHSRALPAASDFVMRDTQGNAYTPIQLPKANVFAYHAGIVPGHGLLPENDTPAYNNPSIRGLLVLFKIKEESFDNRPLVLYIRGNGVAPKQVQVNLDV